MVMGRHNWGRLIGCDATYYYDVVRGAEYCLYGTSGEIVRNGAFRI